MVKIELGQRQEAVTLVISNDGHGVPKDQQERIFERFARVDDARTRYNDGTGLGLAITKDIITAVHNGTIRYNDSPTGDAQFTITLHPLDNTGDA